MNMSHIFSQMAVLFLVLILGFVGNKTKILTTESNKLLSALILNISGPCTVLASVLDGTASATRHDALVFMLLVLAAIAVAFLVAWPIPRLLRAPRSEAGMYRFLVIFGNIGFMGYPVIQAIFGDGGLFYVTLFNIPFNLVVFSIGILMISGKNEKLSLKLLLTPTFIASIAAVAIFFLNITLPKIIADTAILVGHITTPGAMIVIGSTLAGIPFREVFSEKRLYPVVAVKLIVVPVLLWFILHFFIQGGMSLGVVVAETAMPTATVATMLSVPVRQQRQAGRQGRFPDNALFGRHDPAADVDTILVKDSGS